jgi:DNA-binding response OmpR family regulator
MKLLVIDDAPTIRDLLTLHLSNAGHDVRVAEDAIAGGRMILAEMPDLVILDVNMPYMTGYELVQVLKADQATKDLPVILLTSDPDVAEHSSELGADAYLTKPVSATRLVQVVGLFERDQLGAQLESKVRRVIAGRRL